MRKIKNLMFDLGGVIMTIDKENCVRAFESLGLEDARAYFGEFKQTGPFADLESGVIDAAGFHRQMRALLPPGVTDDRIDDAFCRFLIGIPVRRLQQLRQLRGTYGIYLLSNTNPIMWGSFIARQFEQEGLVMRDYFDGMTTSFEAGCMKPDARIFEIAAQTMGINPAETLFLDDSQDNCRAARALGWQAALSAPGTEFMTVLAREGLL